MKKINLLALLTILSSKTYASSGSINYQNYYVDLSRFLISDHGTPSIRFLPTVYLYMDVLQRDPIDLTTFLDNTVAVLIVPLNPIADSIENIPENFFRSEPVSEYLFEPTTKEYIPVLKRDLVNNINQYGKRYISLYLDKSNPQNHKIEFFLRKDAKRKNKDKIVEDMLIDCLKKYKKSSIITDLISWGFLKN